MNETNNQYIEIQVVHKRAYDVYEINMSNMLDKISKGKDKGEEVFLIPEKAIFTESNQVKRYDCIAFSQLEQLEAERLQEIRDIIFVNWDKEWWDNDNSLFIHEESSNKYDGFMRASKEKIAKDIIVKGFDIVKENKEKVRYVKFEESASMAKKGHMTFIRKSIYDEMETRITLGLQEPLYGQGKNKDIISWSQKHDGPALAKWHACKGLSLSNGWNVNELFERLNSLGKIQKKIELNCENVVVVDDWENHVIYQNFWENKTVGQQNCDANEVRYNVELMNEKESKDENYSDGEGFVSEEFGAYLEQLLLQTEKTTGALSSFQIRLPFIKGMVHRVNFKRYFYENNIAMIKDSYGKMHAVDTIEMILTKNMFKAYKWFNWLNEKVNKETDVENAWQYYWKQIKEKNHSLYITEKNNVPEIVDKNNNSYTYLNYQVLHTIGLSSDEIMELARQTLRTLRKYENKELRNMRTIESADMDDDEELEENELGNENVESSYIYEQQAMKINSAFCRTEAILAKEKESSNTFVSNFEKGKLLVKGTTRYLSTDLFGLMQHIGNKYGCDKYGKEIEEEEKNKQSTILKNQFFAPGFSGLKSKQEYGIFRNPHIAQNEHVLLKPLPVEIEDKLQHYKRYFESLTGVLMVSPAGLAAQRMGGADYDGDKVHLVNNKIYNKALKNNKIDQLPIIRIKPASIQQGQWSKRKEYREKEYELCKAIIGNRVGIFSNWAFMLGCRAYGFFDDSKKEEYKKKTLAFTIYTGLELDSVKSGVRPRIEKKDYEGIESKNAFLQMKKGKKIKEISYYKNLEEEINKTDSTEKFDARIKKAFDNMNSKKGKKMVASAMLLLPYYIDCVKEDYAEKKDSSKQSSYKEDPTGYIFSKAYEQSRKEWIIADQSMETILEALAYIQDGLNTANQEYKYYASGNYVLHKDWEAIKALNEIKKILYIQHSDEEAEKKLETMQAYIRSLDFLITWRDIENAIQELEREHFELRSDEKQKRRIVHNCLENIDKNDENQNEMLLNIFCDFGYDGYKIIYLLLKLLKAQKKDITRTQIETILLSSESKFQLSNMVIETEDIWKVFQKWCEKEAYIEETVITDKLEYCDETCEIIKMLSKKKRQKKEKKIEPEKLRKILEGEVTIEEEEKLRTYYKEQIAQFRESVRREQEARKSLMEVINMETGSDDEELLLKVALENWKRHEKTRQERKREEHFLWQVAGKEMVKMAKRLEEKNA